MIAKGVNKAPRPKIDPLLLKPGDKITLAGIKYQKMPNGKLKPLGRKPKDFIY